MKYQIGLIQNTAQAPFFHVESETPLPAISKGDLVQAGTTVWEAQSVLHRFLADNTGMQWAVTMVLVVTPMANLAGRDLVPWPFAGWETGNA